MDSHETAFFSRPRNFGASFLQPPNYCVPSSLCNGALFSPMFQSLLNKFSPKKTPSASQDTEGQTPQPAPSNNGLSNHVYSTRPLLVHTLPSHPPNRIPETPFQYAPMPSSCTYGYPTPSTSSVSPVIARSRHMSLAPSLFPPSPSTPTHFPPPRPDTPEEIAEGSRDVEIRNLVDRYLRFEIRAERYGPGSPPKLLAFLCPKCKSQIRTGLEIPREWPKRYEAIGSQHFHQLLNHMNSCDVEEEDHFQVRSSSAPPEAHHDTPDVERMNVDSFSFCSGVRISWNVPGGLYTTFPWARLVESGHGSLPIRIELHNKGDTLMAWSKNCDGEGDPTTCHQCKELPALFERLEYIAQNASPGTNYIFLNMEQMKQILLEQYDNLQLWKMKTLNLQRDLANALRRLDDHERLIQAISERDLPRVHQLLAQARKQGVGIPGIIHRLQLAFDGLYSPKGFCNFDFDLAIMVLRIGGSHLLKILSDEVGLPSLRQLRNRLLFIKINPSLGPITKDTANANINDVFLRGRLPNESGVDQLPKRGIRFMVDEIALNEQAVYLKDQNSVGGLCREHSHQYELVLESFSDVTRLARRVATGEVHLGKEMTVVVVSIFGESSVFPLVCSPTCKKGGAEDSENLFRAISDAFHEHPIVGKLEAFCWYTDGDPSRRKGGHRYFVQIEVRPGTQLHSILSRLPGLNLMTGPFSLTIGFDWRHVDKRFATLVRSTAGICLNQGHRINRSMLLRWFMKIPDMTEAKARQLLWPRDAQSVPRALELFQAIINLSKLSIDARHVAEQQDLDAISMLAEILASLRDAFVQTSWSLSQSVASLSKFAHLLFAQFHANRLAFCSNPLYYDSQSMVKNIMFNIAKQQILDKSQPVKVAEDGDNDEEKFFGIIRMAGGQQCPNFNYREGLSRCGSTVDMNHGYEKHPEWRPTQHRLDVSSAEGMDKIGSGTPWSGDIISGHCDLELAWLQGRKDAVEVLQHSEFPIEINHFDFDTLFKDIKIDLMRPFGDGLYPGVSAEDDLDPSMNQEPTPDDIAALDEDIDGATYDDAPALPLSDPSPDDGEVPVEDDECDHPFDQRLETHYAIQTPDKSTSTNVDQAIAAHASRETGDVGHATAPQGRGVDLKDFLVADNGKYIHKATIVSRLITPNYSSKSHDRLHRVRTFTDANSDPFGLVNVAFTDPLQFYVGDLVLTLAKTKESIGLILLRTTAITQNGVSSNSIYLDSMGNAGAKIVFTGQIYRLEPQMVSDRLHWTTNGQYIMDKSAIKGSSVVTDKVVCINVGAHLCEIVKPDLIPSESLDESSLRRVSWRVEDKVLQILMTALWEKYRIADKPFVAMPTLKGGQMFPYCSTDGEASLVCQDAVNQLSESNTSAIPTHCEYCNEKIDIATITAYWNHISQHILKKHRGVKELNLRKEIGDGEPCAFCGHSGQAACKIYISWTGTQTRTYHIHSDCPFFAKIQYGRANKGSQNTPCRNVPIICDLCNHPEPPRSTGQRPAVWRYNMIPHILLQHPEYRIPGDNDDGTIDLPRELAEQMTVPTEEQSRMGIPNHLSSPPLLKDLTVELEWIKNANEKLNKAKGKKRTVSNVEGAQEQGSGSSKRPKTSKASQVTPSVAGPSRGRGRGGRRNTRGRGGN
ncbi:hypothetical protein VKT23_010871 [Stygiomarasmius scandens]|uniref:Uncharacterized protein n=1 Tax=Marasmiellus scandens TaxID=2682957 RepID=A0ABR1JDT4_9AGAR